MAGFIAENVSIHPRAEIDSDVEIGPFSVIGPDVHIGRGTRMPTVGVFRSVWVARSSTRTV